MPYTNLQIEWTDLIRFSSDGMVVADYVQIKSALVARYKQIYGQDIDVSPTTADGIWLETIALLVNNTLQAIKTMYSNLDIRSATGNFLDMLASISNVSRKEASKSTVTIGLKLLDEGEWTPTEDIRLFDRAGNEWVHRLTTNEPALSNEDASPTVFLFEAAQTGPISAPGGTAANNYLDGWICGTVDSTPTLEIYQEHDAALGDDIESDTDLRARQHDSGNPLGYTTLESLVGALYAVTGVEDVKIYNNGTNLGDVTQAKDGVSVNDHTVYIILRTRPNIAIQNATIGNIILNKLTSGVLTNQVVGDTHHGIGHEYEFTQQILGQDIPTLRQKVYWKDATPLKPKVSILLTAKEFFAFDNDSTAKAIASNVINYLNNIKLSQDIDYDEVKEIVKYSDPKFRGQTTFVTKDIDILDYVKDVVVTDITSFDARLAVHKLYKKVSNEYIEVTTYDSSITDYYFKGNPDTYYDYSMNDVDIQIDDDDVLITIGE